MTPERKATIVAMSTAAFLAATKTTIGLFSGSMAVLASATDSVSDLFVSFINFLAVGKSQTPEDHTHDYGHGKIEGFAAFFEGIMIGGSAILLVVLSIKKIVDKTGIQDINKSAVVMIVSFIITFFLVGYLRRIAKTTRSLIIKADELHYRTDLLINGGVFISLIMIKLTGLILIDSVVSIVIAGYIMKSAVEVIRDSLHMLLDGSLSSELKNKIIQIIETANPLVQGYHCLRTRTSGKTTFIDVHIVFKSTISLMEAHAIAETIEQSLDIQIPGAIATIHLDPYDDRK